LVIVNPLKGLKPFKGSHMVIGEEYAKSINPFAHQKFPFIGERLD
jgi:hypothetical protein